MNTLRLALRMLARDWRAGELTVLAAALVLAVASVGTVAFFADRVKTALTRQANLLLGADLMISGDRPLPATFADEAARARPQGDAGHQVQQHGPARRGGGRRAAARCWPTSRRSAPGYPLRSAIMLVDAGAARRRGGHRHPGARRGVARPRGSRNGWARRSATASPSAKRRSTVSAIVQQEPEVASGTARDRAAPAGQHRRRAGHQPAAAGQSRRRTDCWSPPPTPARVDAYTGVGAGARCKPGQRLENVRDLRPEVRQTLDRAEQFLGLAALVAVILAAVAVALAASRYLRRHLDTAAMLRCLGAPERRTLALFVLQFGVLGVLASAAGVVLALGGQQLLVMLLGSITTADLPLPGIVPALGAFGTGLLLLFGFALPPLVALAGAPPLRVLRRDLPRPRAGGVAAYVLGVGVIALLIGWQAQDVKTGAIMVGGIAGLLVAAALVAWALIVLLKRLPQRGVTWRFGLANLRRRPLASSLQIGALALGLMALLLLTIVRGDLLANWRASLPPDAPNHFLINVLPDQVDGVRALIAPRSRAPTSRSIRWCAGGWSR